jgi:hypothetical protein
LTYSNKIDVKQEICPDQLAGNFCPRGTLCNYQHFESLGMPGMSHQMCSLPLSPSHSHPLVNLR